MRREYISQCISVSVSSMCPVKKEGKEGGREGKYMRWDRISSQTCVSIHHCTYGRLGIVFFQTQYLCLFARIKQ